MDELESTLARLNGEHRAFESVVRLMRRYRKLYNDTRKRLVIHRIISAVLLLVAVGAWFYAR